MGSKTPQTSRIAGDRATRPRGARRPGRGSGPIGGLGRLCRLGGIAAVAAAGLLTFPSPPARADVGMPPPSWLSAPDDGARSAVAELEAQLVRRQGGEWVIVSLTPRSAGPMVVAGPPAAPDPSGDAPTANVSDYVAVQSTLHEYERAIEKRDAARLAQVWMMNPAEQAQLQYLFDKSRSISVSIEDSDIDVNGDRASMRFAQRFVVSRRGDSPPGFKRRSSRTLFASDAPGRWDIDSVLEK